MASPGKKSFLLRIDPKLWSEIEAWAQQDLRSVNGQIEFLLRDAVRRRGRPSEEPKEDPARSDTGDESGISPP